MPLPRTDAPWPPPELAPARDLITVHDAWWSGDPDELRNHYDRHASGFINRPSQHAGGIIGGLSRMFWGRPRAHNDPDAKLHVPLAGDLCQAWADLLFSEPVAITSTNGPTTDRLADILGDGMHARLLEAAETVAALGGGYLRPAHDVTIADEPWVDVVAPDAGQPEWSGGRLAAVNFWRIVRTEQDGNVVYRHVERHEPGWIVHRLYQGGPDRIGREVPLQDDPSTVVFAAGVNSDGAIDTDHTRLDVVYIPRIRPNRAWRKLPALAPMGRSLLDGAVPLLDALDETYSSWMRDIRLAKGRLFAADSVLDTRGPGQGATFDGDREVFAKIPGAMGKDESLTIVQFAIRVDEHRDTARELVNTIMRRAGLNGSTLGEPTEGGMRTATEVVSQERRSMTTRERSVRYWKPELGNLAAALLATDRRVYSSRVDPDADLSVLFADSVSEDPRQLAETAELLFRADSASVETRVRYLHKDWTDDQVRAEVQAILDQRGPVIDAPFGGDDDGADELEPA